MSRVWNARLLLTDSESSALCKPGPAIGKLSGAKGTTRPVDDALGAAIVLRPTGLNTMRCARERSARAGPGGPR